MGNYDNGIEINVKELLFTLLRRIWIIVLATSICAAGAWYYTANYMQPYYRSSAKLYVINKQYEDRLTYSDLQLGSNLTQDYMILITSRPVMEKVTQTLNLNMSTEALAGLISVYTPENTRVLEITVTHTDPDLAKLLVDTIATVSTESMVSIMGIDKVNVVEEGSYPYYPAGPNISRNMKLAGLAGGFLAALLISILHVLNDTIRTAEDVEKHLKITVLGAIPVEGKDKRKKNKDKNKSSGEKHRIKTERKGTDAA